MSAKRALRGAGATKHTSHESTTAAADTVNGVLASSLLLPAAFCACIVQSSSSSVSSSSSLSSASDWLSPIILSEPTAWLTARRKWSRVYVVLSNLSMHILMRLSFIKITRFFARLIGKPLVIPTDCLWLFSGDDREMGINCDEEL